MKGKMTWIVAGCFLVISTLVASCSSAPAEAPTTADKASAPASGAAAAPAGGTKAESQAVASEAPKYGGVLNVYWTADPTGFDQSPNVFYKVNNTDLTNEELITGDWAKGPAGTKDATWWISGDNSLDKKIGTLAESWKIVEPGHMVFKIRHGVHYSLDPNNEASRLVNGRELTADDVVYTLNRNLKGNKFTGMAAPNMVANTVVTSPDKDTVELKTPPEETMMAIIYLVWGASIVPPEVVQKYGDMADWHHSVGTGPFMLTDYVSGSQLTFAKNPNYWQKDSVGPGKGNQLPYLDGVKILVLTDPSTRNAAIQTGKLDYMSPLVRDDYNSVRSTAKQLQSVKFMSPGTSLVFMRVDKPDLPFKDVRVRQALAMAIDYKSVVDKLQGGDGEYPGFPTANIPDFKDIYFPLSEAPKAVQDIWSYDPTRAKQLLAEAGYPNGFKTDIVVNSTGGTQLDEVAVFKDAWAKIGVDLTIKPMEFAQWTNVTSSRSYDQMAYSINGSHGIYLIMINWVGSTRENGTFNLDEAAKTARAQMFAATSTGDIPKADAIYKEFEKHAMEQVWMIPYPRANNYTVWQPWLKNYHGETSVGYLNGYSWSKWVWIDQDLKKSMGY